MTPDTFRESPLPPQPDAIPTDGDQAKESMNATYACANQSPQNAPMHHPVNYPVNAINYYQVTQKMPSQIPQMHQTQWHQIPTHPAFAHGGTKPLMASSPSITSNLSFSGGASPNQIPDSPQLLDASHLLMSPTNIRKRRQLSPLINGSQLEASPSLSTPQIPIVRRVSMPKMPVAPTNTTFSHQASSKGKPGNLILPCFFDQNNNLRVHGQMVDGAPGTYWESSRRTAQAFLKEAASVDEENITIIEIKQLLRRYSINATGKKNVLMDRIKRLQEHLKADLQRQEEILTKQAAQALVDAGPKSFDSEQNNHVPSSQIAAN